MSNTIEEIIEDLRESLTEIAIDLLNPQEIRARSVSTHVPYGSTSVPMGQEIEVTEQELYNVATTLWESDALEFIDGKWVIV